MERDKLHRIVLYLIPAVTLLALTLILCSGEYLKKPTGEADNFPYYLQLLKQDINNENWNKAREDAVKLQSSWENILTRIQYSVSSSEVNQVTNGISRIRGAIAARDKAGALVELKELENHWNALGTLAAAF